ncbi:MAG: acyl-CoA thioesterase [Firmicutes bacterium HGW-Firmicutes-15]|nr:MAG: acyl-CoA thioesterase [Firmicutes bacterium HGW-Firmicutes-15]
MEAKSASASRVTMAQVVLPYHANAAGNMHGGEVMKLMDSAAGVVAQRHCLCNVVTVSVDKLVFKEPILVGDLVVCDAELIFTGRTSMEIYVTVKVENLRLGEIKLALEGYFVMIALDRNGRPTPVSPLKLETAEQEQRFQKARERLNKS